MKIYLRQKVSMWSRLVVDVFLLENDEKRISIIKDYLQEKFNLTLASFDSPDEILTELRKDSSSNVKLFLSKSSMVIDGDSSLVSKVLYNYSYDLEKKIPLIVMGDIDLPGEFVHSLPEKFLIEELGRLVKKVMNFSNEELAFYKLPEYVPVLISNFYLMSTSCSDIYIRIKKKTGDQFVKRFLSGDAIGKEELHKYEAKSVVELFIKKEDHLTTMNFLLKQSMEKLKELQTSGENAMVIASDSYDITHNLILSMGINEQSVKMSNASLASLKNNIKSSTDDLETYLENLLSNQGSLAFKRSYLIILFAHYVIPMMKLGEEGSQQNILDQISFTSYFHDYYLLNEAHQAIMSKTELDSAGLSKQDQEHIMNHANNATTLIQSYPHAPIGVDIIIRQHHGTMNGVGFVEKYNPNISPTSILFVVLEAIANEVIKTNTSSNSYADILKQAIVKYETIFTIPSFRKILETLKTSNCL